MSKNLSSFLVEGFCMLVVAVCGIFLNISSVIYFAQLRQQRAFHRLLLTLAIMDTIHLIASALTFSICYLSDDYANTGWNFVVPYSLPIAQTSMTSSVYLTISLTVERYFSVVKPFVRMKNKCLRSSVFLAIPGIVFSVFFTLPNYFMLKTVYFDDPILEKVDTNASYLMDISLEDLEQNMIKNISTNQGLVQLMVRDSRPFQVMGFSRVPTIQFADFRSNQTYITVYVMWLHLLFNTIIPFIILLSMNTAIYRKLSSLPHTNLRRSAEGRLRRRELRLARISLLIVIIFIFCHSLKILPSIFEILGYPPELIPGVLPISHLLLTTNCSVNFLVYYLASGRALSRLIPLPSFRSIKTEKRKDCPSFINTQETAYTDIGLTTDYRTS